MLKIKIIRKAQAIGLFSATAVLVGLLHHARTGLPLPARIEVTPFQVAVMSGEKQAAQEAVENVEATQEEAPTPDANALIAQSQDTESQLPDAIKAAAAPNLVEQGAASKTEVIPPAQVSMPGGVIASTDAEVSRDTGPDPLLVGAKQVYIRLFVNIEGKVMRGGVVRSGSNPFQDALLLRIVKSRIYQVSNALPSSVKDAEGNPTWQVDLVLDYDNDSLIP